VQRKTDSSQNVLVVKSNRIIEASYNLPLNGHRLLSLVISCIPRGATSLDLVCLRVSDVAKRFPGLRGTKSAHKELEDIVEQIMEAHVTIREGDERWVKYQWVTKAAYEHGKIYFKLNDELLPYLTSLISFYTAYELKNVINFKTTYQFRIYDLLKQYESIGERIIYVEELRRYLCIPDDQYHPVGNLKARVIVPSVSHISEVSDIRVEIGKDIKQGRRVVGFRFFFSHNAKAGFAIAEEVPPVVKRMLLFGIHKDAAEELFKKHDESYINQQLNYVEEEFKKGRVKDIAGFAVSAIHNQYLADQPKVIQEEITRKKINRKTDKNLQEQDELQHLRSVFNLRRVKRFLDQLSQEELTDLKDQYLGSTQGNPVITNIIKKHGFESPIVKGHFYEFVKSNKLSPPGDREFEKFLRQERG